MLITASNLDALFISFSAQFKDAYMSTPQPLVETIGTKLPSVTRDTRYPIVQAISGAMREWLGERQAQNLVVDGITVTNKKWENTVAIQRTDIEDDQYGVYSSMLIPNLARHAKLLPDQQIAARVNAGNSELGYDGKAIYATDHPVDPSGQTTGSQSNSLTGKPLNATNLAVAQAAMQNFLGPDGLPMGILGDTLLVPPSLKYTADTLAHATFFPIAQNGNSSVFSAASNMFQGQYKVVSSPWLTDSGDPTTAVWYLLSCNGMMGMRPFFWQEREAPQLVSLIDPANPVVFFQDIYTMGARSRGAASASLWFLGIRVSGA